jgi:hypothetical protein
MECTMIVSAETLDAAGWRQPDWRRADVEIRGRDGTMSVLLIERRDQCAAVGSPGPAMAPMIPTV